MDLICLLNENNGLVISSLTAVLVLTTIWYTVVTSKILKINKQAHFETIRPYVLVSFESIDAGLEFSVKNYGQTASYKTKITIEPPLDDLDMSIKQNNDSMGHKNMLSQDFMPPSFEVRTVLNFSQEIVNKEDLEMEYAVTIDYETFDGQKLNTVYTVDLSSLIFKEKIRFNRDNYYFGKISKSLEEITEILEK